MMSASGARPLAKPPMKAPRTAGIPCAATTRASTRRSRRCRTEPVAALSVLTRMLVPAATGAGNPRRSRKGRRIVPRASPTMPPSTPTPYESRVRKSASQSGTADGRPKAESGRVTDGSEVVERGEDRGPDAVVSGEPADEEPLDAALAEAHAEVPPFRVLCLKARVGILVGVHPLGDHDRLGRERERRMKFGALRSLHTVGRPEPAVGLEVAGNGRVPVARGVDGRFRLGKAPDVAVENRHHPVAFRNRQGAAGAEIVLHVHDNERVEGEINPFRHGVAPRAPRSGRAPRPRARGRAPPGPTAPGSARGPRPDRGGSPARRRRSGAGRAAWGARAGSP